MTFGLIACGQTHCETALAIGPVPTHRFCVLDKPARGVWWPLSKNICSIESVPLRLECVENTGVAGVGI